MLSRITQDNDILNSYFGAASSLVAPGGLEDNQRPRAIDRS